MDKETQKTILAVIVVLLIICCFSLKNNEHAVSNIDKILLNNKFNKLKGDLKENIIETIQKRNEIHGINIWKTQKIKEEIKDLELKKQFIIDEMSVIKNKMMKL